jgi:hypothetical protein
MIASYRSTIARVYDSDMQFTFPRYRPGLLALMCAYGATQTAGAAEWRGLLDVRAVDADASRSFTDSGLGKLRYDSNSGRFSLGQAVLRGDFDLLDTVGATVDISASDQHHGVLDVREAFLTWSPVPTGAWKTRVKAGQFFPPSSVEIDYDGIGWTPKRTISSSAINSWIGEELRTNGLEWSAKRLGRYVGAPYDVGFVGAVYTGNDPTGTLLAWRGWSISDRIAGRNEALELADLPVYRRTRRDPAPGSHHPSVPRSGRTAGLLRRRQYQLRQPRRTGGAALR